MTKEKSQHFYFTLLTRASVKKFEEDIVLHGTLHDKARTLSNNGSLAGAWLHNVPKKDELHMKNDDKLGELRTPHHDDSLAADGCVKGLFDKPTHIDVTIANPTGQTYLRMGAHSQRHIAIKTREKYKDDKYKNRSMPTD